MRRRDVTDAEVDYAVNNMLNGPGIGLMNEMMLDSSVKTHRRIEIKNSMLSSTYCRDHKGSFTLLGAVSSTRERLVDVHSGVHYTTYKMLFNGHVLAMKRYMSEDEHKLGELIESFDAHIGPNEGEGN